MTEQPSPEQIGARSAFEVDVEELVHAYWKSWVRGCTVEAGLGGVVDELRRQQAAHGIVEVRRDVLIVVCGLAEWVDELARSDWELIAGVRSLAEAYDQER